MSASIAALVAQLAELTEVLRPVAARLAAGVETSPAGRDTEPSPEVPAVATTGQPGSTPVDERAEQIAGLRELADYLEAHPDLPLGPYDVQMQIHVSNLPHMYGKDETARLAELARIGEALGIDADLRDEPGAPHPHATKRFRGGAEYRAVYVTEAYRRGYKPADTATTDIPRGGGEVAGPAGEAGPATAPEPDPCPKGDPGCETGDDGSCHDACEPATAPGDDDEGPVAGCECEDCEDLRIDAMDEG